MKITDIELTPDFELDNGPEKSYFTNVKIANEDAVAEYDAHNEDGEPLILKLEANVNADNYARTATGAEGDNIYDDEFSEMTYDMLQNVVSEVREDLKGIKVNAKTSSGKNVTMTIHHVKIRASVDDGMFGPLLEKNLAAATGILPVINQARADVALEFSIDADYLVEAEEQNGEFWRQYVEDLVDEDVSYEFKNIQVSTDLPAVPASAKLPKFDDAVECNSGLVKLYATCGDLDAEFTYEFTLSDVEAYDVETNRRLDEQEVETLFRDEMILKEAANRVSVEAEADYEEQLELYLKDLRRVEFAPDYIFMPMDSAYGTYDHSLWELSLEFNIDNK
jgi:hypothetical protein